MRSLSAPLRKQLETSVLAARRAAESASRAAIEGLGVFLDRRPEHLNAGQTALRIGLRAKWRQLGDDRALLVSECAYEQWHRLLFARFLAENRLLLHPQYKAPVTLPDCEELAADLGEPDGWSVAARFAAEILPGIFRTDDPCVCLRLAPEGRHVLEQILELIPEETFGADDALGWVYQFWQKDKKDEVNASERKIGGADLGPVTQLFTENYMVRFVLENSLGAWWAARHPDSPLVKGFDYLRVDEDGQPVSGAFEEWPDRVAEVTVMDPCCGSGHFLVEAFSMLWQMRAEEEGLSPIDAQDAALRDNLFGLELDARCVQIAMFAVALQAWKAGGRWRQLPAPNIACSGIPAKAPVEEWKALAGGDRRLETALVRLHILFRDADTLGSLIDPRRAAEPSDQVRPQRSFDDVDWEEIAPLLESAVAAESSADPAVGVFGAAASGLARAAGFLSRQYVLQVTNVPYLSRTKQDSQLRSYADVRHPRAKHDLATMMLERLLDSASASVFAVLPQGWTQLSRYRPLREAILKSRTLRLCAFLGPGAFTAISGEVVNAILLMVDAQKPEASSSWVAIDVAEKRDPSAKAQSLSDATLVTHTQKATMANPDARIVPHALATGPLLSEHANSLYGLRTGDGARLIRKFWELCEVPSGWRFHQSTTVGSRSFTGREHVLHWEDGRGVLAELAAEGIASLQGEGAWGRAGVVVSLMGDLPVTRYTGESFDNNCAVVWPNRGELLPAVWAYLTDESFAEAVRRIDRSLKVTNQTLLKVPFDVDHWRKVAEGADPLPEPWSKDPTQWLFKGRPEVSTAPLQVAVARLIGYRWPEQAESDDLDVLADLDGIVCLPSVAGEAPAADRVLQLLATAYGESWSPARVKELLDQAGSKKKNLADWLRDEFFKQHCALFGNRPFVWHVWDGLRDGFSALVNYHCLDRKMLAKLTYTYLGQDWVERQRAEVREEVPGAETRLSAALELQRKLEAILEGETPFDIYVRWQQLYEQPIGWDPDLNDGVRLNVRPFVEAGVLRTPFNIHWRKDRGKNPGGSERHNDIHFTLAQKIEARKEVGRA
jgi:hypothetical protein